VAVDPNTHRVYFPLRDINGKPVLRIAVPWFIRHVLQMDFETPIEITR